MNRGVLAEQRLWEAICAALGLTELAATEYAARLAAPESVNEQVAIAVAALDLDDALDRLRGEGAPVSPVLTPERATSHEQLMARRTFLETANGLVPDLPAQLERHPRRSAVEIPGPGAHPDGFTPRSG